MAKVKPARRIGTNYELQESFKELPKRLGRRLSSFKLRILQYLIRLVPNPISLDFLRSRNDDGPRRSYNSPDAL